MPAPSILRQVGFPEVSYGPFRLVEAVPWLMLATAMRIIYATAAFAIPAFILANIAILLAFLVAARRMIELADGRTRLGGFSFAEQIAIAASILTRVGALAVGGTLVALAWGASGLAAELFGSFDGIAFDGPGLIGKAASGLIAALILLMALQVDRGEPVRLIAALRELAARARTLLPTLAAILAFLAVFGLIQGIARGGVHHFWVATPISIHLKNFVYFAFVFCFAAARLWAVLAILTFGLRLSYARGEGSPAASG